MQKLQTKVRWSGVCSHMLAALAAGTARHAHRLLLLGDLPLRCSLEGRAACAQYSTNSTCSPSPGQAGPCAWWPENNMASLIGAWQPQPAVGSGWQHVRA